MANVSEEQENYFVNRVIKNNIGLLKSRYRDTMDRIKSYKERLTSELMNLNMINDQISVAENGKKFNLQGKIDEIEAMPKITKCEVNGSCIKFETVPLVCRASNGGLYDVGAYSITIDATDTSITFMNLDPFHRRRSYWDKYCQHPHVSDQGEACLGNSSEALAVLNSQHEYAAMASICIAFLEQANLDDCAGRCVKNWDQIDTDGNVIEVGAWNSSEDCFEYDKEDYLNDAPIETIRDNFYDEYHNIDEVTLIPEKGGYYTNEYIEKNLVKCSNCGKYENKREAFQLENGDYICKECKKTYKRCAICGRYSKELEEVELEGDGKVSICKTCKSTLNTCKFCGKLLNPDRERKIAYTDDYVDFIHKDDPSLVRDENYNLIYKKDAIKCKYCGDYVHKTQSPDGIHCKTCYEDNVEENNSEETESAFESNPEKMYFETAEEAEAFFAKKGENE